MKRFAAIASAAILVFCLASFRSIDEFDQDDSQPDASHFGETSSASSTMDEKPFTMEGLSSSTPWGEAGGPSIAFGNNGYLVVWEELTQQSPYVSVIFAKRIDGDGTGWAPFIITTVSTPPARPRVAFSPSGGKFLVLWQEQTAYPPFQIRGALAGPNAVEKFVTFPASSSGPRMPEVTAGFPGFLVGAIAPGSNKTTLTRYLSTDSGVVQALATETISGTAIHKVSSSPAGLCATWLSGQKPEGKLSTTGSSWRSLRSLPWGTTAADAPVCAATHSSFVFAQIEYSNILGEPDPYSIRLFEVDSNGYRIGDGKIPLVGPGARNLHLSFDGTTFYVTWDRSGFGRSLARLNTALNVLGITQSYAPTTQSELPVAVGDGHGKAYMPGWGNQVPAVVEWSNIVCSPCWTLAVPAPATRNAAATTALTEFVVTAHVEAVLRSVETASLAA